METSQLLYVFVVIFTLTVSSHAAQSEFLKYFFVSETVEKSAETQWTGEDKNPEVQTQYEPVVNPDVQTQYEPVVTSDVQTQYKPVVTSDVQTQYEPVVTSPKEANYKLSYANYDITWKNFKLEHKRSYASTSEEERRFAIFMDNVKTIEKHNWQFHLGQSTYWMGINQFSDWTPEEFKAMLLPLDVKSTSMWAGVPRIMYEGDSDVSVPDAIDWRSRGYVTPVKDQGNCGACYAFSTTGSLEGQWYKKTGKLISLSEQQIMDCSSKNNGCNGGRVDWSLEYIIAQGGLESESDYPFTPWQGTCKFQASRAVAKVEKYYNVQKTESALQTVVGTVGPVSVGFPISKKFQNYKGGFFTDSTCKTATIGNHAVLVVGYGKYNGSDCWIVKNSWGTTWGEDGYIYMARNRGNMCGIASDAFLPGV